MGCSAKCWHHSFRLLRDQMSPMTLLCSADTCIQGIWLLNAAGGAKHGLHQLFHGMRICFAGMILVHGGQLCLLGMTMIGSRIGAWNILVSTNPEHEPERRGEKCTRGGRNRLLMLCKRRSRSWRQKILRMESTM